MAPIIKERSTRTRQSRRASEDAKTKMLVAELAEQELEEQRKYDLDDEPAEHVHHKQLQGSIPPKSKVFDLVDVGASIDSPFARVRRPCMSVSAPKHRPSIAAFDSLARIGTTPEATSKPPRSKVHLNSLQALPTAPLKDSKSFTSKESRIFDKHIKVASDNYAKLPMDVCWAPLREKLPNRTREQLIHYYSRRRDAVRANPTSSTPTQGFLSGPFRPEEIQIFENFVNEYGGYDNPASHFDWERLAKRIATRSEQQLRKRFTNKIKLLRKKRLDHRPTRSSSAQNAVSTPPLTPAIPQFDSAPLQTEETQTLPTKSSSTPSFVWSTGRFSPKELHIFDNYVEEHGGYEKDPSHIDWELFAKTIKTRSATQLRAKFVKKGNTGRKKQITVTVKGQQGAESPNSKKRRLRAMSLGNGQTIPAKTPHRPEADNTESEQKHSPRPGSIRPTLSTRSTDVTSPAEDTEETARPTRQAKKRARHKSKEAVDLSLDDAAEATISKRSRRALRGRKPEPTPAPDPASTESSRRTRGGTKLVKPPISDKSKESGESLDPKVNVICPPAPQPFTLIPDPNEFYIEEEAHLYHNPPLPSYKTEGVLPKNLPAIPPPPKLPELPNTGLCSWTYDEETRVLLADFAAGERNGAHATPILMKGSVDEKFLLSMMERDDITVISEGHLDWKSMDPQLWDLNHMCAALDKEFFHRFRRFDSTTNSDGTETILEIDENYSMMMCEYGRYLEKRRQYFTMREAGVDTGDEATNEFSFVDHQGKEHTIDVRVSALYMIDMDIIRQLPDLAVNFDQAFKYKSVLPGGKNCMMNKVTPNARPFMGPNMYVTPPASFTHFHQDGHGTVDSGHLVISGYNEVVILRRLTERHKRHALWLLTGEKAQAEESKPKYFDGLYSEPHGDRLGEKPQWPTNTTIEDCRNMGYCPSVLILKPGQLIHINKGRLHAFRKMATAPLPEGDCHKAQREQVVKERQLSGEELCISIAWDWMYRGCTDRGINREVLTVIEASILNRKRGRQSLAIPELSLLKMGQAHAPAYSSLKLGGIISNLRCHPVGGADDKNKTICRGILPALRYVIQDHLATMESVSHEKSQSMERGERVSLAERPNANENPAVFAVDPYGNSDFLCKLCSKELSNVYFHCDGCEKLLSKDFNICQQCHTGKKFAKLIYMHPCNKKRRAVVNHTGHMPSDRAKRCPCKNGPVCGECGYCLGCSCRCHSWFTLNCRFFGDEVEKQILTRVEGLVSAEKFQACKYLDDSDFTAERLSEAKRHWGHDDDLV